MAKQKAEDFDIESLSIKDKESLIAAIKESHKEMTKLEEAKQNIDDYFDSVHEETGIPKRVFNFLMKASFYANATQVLLENKKLEDAWETFEKLL